MPLPSGAIPTLSTALTSPLAPSTRSLQPWTPRSQASTRSSPSLFSSAPSETKRVKRSTSACSKRAPSASSRQLYLDFGQKSFDAVHTCEACGLVYRIGVESEETTHARYCQSNAVTREVETYKADPSRSTSILLTSPSDPIRVWYESSAIRSKKILARVDAELGFVLASSTAEAEAPVAREETGVFICTCDDTKAIGCLVTERVAWAYCSPSNLRVPVSLGIKKLWVHSAYRRRGVAAKLLDAARAHLGYPNPIRKDQIAISNPTPLGHLFLAQYGREGTFPLNDSEPVLSQSELTCPVYR